MCDEVYIYAQCTIFSLSVNLMHFTNLACHIFVKPIDCNIQDNLYCITKWYFLGKKAIVCESSAY